MPRTFLNPPLIELIAEARWLPEGIRFAPNDASSLEVAPTVFTQTGHDEFYLRFAGLAGPRGYSQIERVVPPGFPNIPFQPIYRYREGGANPGPAIYQLGVGIFSTNTTRPYTSYSYFRPIVETGLQLLLAASDELGKPKEFVSVALRYIDGFDEQFSRGRTYGNFIRDILGFNCRLPPAITRHVSDAEKIRPHLDVFAPLKNGLQLNLKLADSHVMGKRTVLMETSVSAQLPVVATVDATMAALDAAHNVIHSSFVEMSESLHDVMKPIEDSL